MELTRGQLVQFYKTMNLIRKFELKAIELAGRGEAFGNMHMYIGEEAIATGVMAALEPTDVITSSHRCDGHIIAKGGDPKKLLAELMGRETGYCKGRSGKMHLAATEVGMMGANGIVGAGIPLAAGMALYSKIYKTGQVAISFFGDGAVNHGYFHESINMAALWKLPVVFVCENNLYAISTHIKTAMACENVADRGAAYNIPGVIVDGNDVIEVYKAAKEAVERARRGKGPTLIEAKTYRFRGHHEGDAQTYRTKEEIEMWKSKGPIKRLKALLVDKYSFTQQEEAAVMKEVEEIVDEAVEFGFNSPYPKEEELEKYVFVDEVIS